MLAECEELASTGANGFPLAGPYDDMMGIGYGLVTVSPGLTVNAWATFPGMSATPAPASYQNRLAWVLVSRDLDYGVAFCPAESATSQRATQTQKYTGYSYEIFIIDAATGGDAVIYNESSPRPCGISGLVPPSLNIPVEQTSVSWKLDSRAPDGEYGTVTAYVPPCDGHDKEAGVIPGTALVRVLAYGPVAASCGPPRPVSVYLLPAGVFETLPSVLVHAQTGLYITGTPNTGSLGSSPAPLKGKLVTVAGPSGQTITVPVGDVVVASTFPGPDPMHPDPVYSGDPAVLDRIGPPQLQNQMPWEFRALRPGQATLHCAFQNWTAHVLVVAA
jgi:hypothetical protein